MLEGSLTTDHEDRRVGAPGVGNTGHAIGDTRTRGHDRHSDRAGVQTSPGIGRVDRGLLMADVDDLDVFVEASVVDTHDVTTGQREHALDARGRKGPGCQLTSVGHLNALSLVGTCSHRRTTPSGLWNHVNVIISVPSSSANLGPGFDTLGIALSVTMDVEIGAQTLSALDENHPATRAFRLGGGTGDLGGTMKIPPGKGMGFSGASRVAGFAAAAVQSGQTLDDSRDDVFRLAAEAEGHPDNAAPSTYGGITITSGGRVLQLPVLADLSVVM